MKNIGGGQYERVVNTGEIVGLTSLKEGGVSTQRIKIITDSAGNIITCYPIR